MDVHTLRIFQRKAIKSKREILEALNDYSAHLLHDEGIHRMPYSIDQH